MVSAGLDLSKVSLVSPAPTFSIPIVPFITHCPFSWAGAARPPGRPLHRLDMAVHNADQRIVW
jgi:hypothetical protein